MATSPDEWMEGQADRILSRQRAQADNAKLVATFAAAIAGGLAGSALGARSNPWGLDLAAGVLPGLTVLLTGAVVFLVRVSDADHKSILDEADNDQQTGRSWTDAYMLYRLQPG